MIKKIDTSFFKKTSSFTSLKTTMKNRYTYSATIGGEDGVASLAEACALAPTTGELTKVTLSEDTTAPGYMLLEGQNISVDLDGHTYTASKFVGSKGTENQIMRIEKNCSLTVSNGEFLSGEDTTASKWTKANFIFQNYGDLVLNDMVLDATNEANNKVSYLVSNNMGSFTPHNCTFIGGDDNKTIVFDAWYALSSAWGSDVYRGAIDINIDATNKITGKIEFGAQTPDNYVEEWGKAVNVRIAEGVLQPGSTIVASSNIPAGVIVNIYIGDTKIISDDHEDIKNGTVLYEVK